MRFAALLAATLAIAGLAPAVAQDNDVQIVVYVEPSGIAKAAVLTTGTDEISTALAGDVASAPLAFKPGAVEDLPGNLTIEWDEQNSTSLPAFVFTPYSGKQIPIRVYRYNFTINDSEKAEKLCWHTQPEDLKSAFRALFGCQEWVKLLEANDEKWTNSQLKGLRGWFDGSYYLFTRVRPIHGLGLSPWGLQDELVERLREILAEIDAGHKRASDFEPILRIADIRQALTEFDRWELRLFGLIPQMIAAKDYAGALRVNERVREAYVRYAGPLATGSIDGVSQSNLDGNDQLIREKLKLVSP